MGTCFSSFCLLARTLPEYLAVLKEFYRYLMKICPTSNLYLFLSILLASRLQHIFMIVI